MRESCDNSYKLQVLVILVLVPGLLMLLPCCPLPLRNTLYGI